MYRHLFRRVINLSKMTLLTVTIHTTFANLGAHIYRAIARGHRGGGSFPAPCEKIRTIRLSNVDLVRIPVMITSDIARSYARLLQNRSRNQGPDGSSAGLGPLAGRSASLLQQYGENGVAELLHTLSRFEHRMFQPLFEATRKRKPGLMVYYLNTRGSSALFRDALFLTMTRS